MHSVRTRAVWVVAVAALVVATVAAAAEPTKRYTIRAAAPWTVVSPEKLVVSLPAGWQVAPTWMRGKTRPSAADPVHTGVKWWLSAFREEKGTTLAAIRHREAFRGWRDVWGEGTPLTLQVGDTYLRLPVGKVWRQSLLFVPPDKNWAERYYWRSYWVDRGVVRDAVKGDEKQLFLAFVVSCTPSECRTHNGQLAAIMRSIRPVS